MLYSSLHLFVACNKHFTYVAAGLWVPLRLAVLRGSVDGVEKGTSAFVTLYFVYRRTHRSCTRAWGPRRTANKMVAQGVC